jgi:hypothetical protein
MAASAFTNSYSSFFRLFDSFIAGKVPHDQCSKRRIV